LAVGCVEAGGSDAGKLSSSSSPKTRSRLVSLLAVGRVRRPSAVPPRRSPSFATEPSDLDPAGRLQPPYSSKLKRGRLFRRDATIAALPRSHLTRVACPIQGSDLLLFGCPTARDDVRIGLSTTIASFSSNDDAGGECSSSECGTSGGVPEFPNECLWGFTHDHARSEKSTRAQVGVAKASDLHCTCDEGICDIIRRIAAAR
jgi:hypothetical protein